MIAAPIKTDKYDAAVAPLFGKAKWFAFIDKNDDVIIEKNELKNGLGVVEWLLEKGVNALLIQNMSQMPYEYIQKDGRITIFYVGSDRIELGEVVKKYIDESLVIIDDSNADKIIKIK